VLDAVAGLVPSATGSDCVLVAVDGVDGAGKTVFAGELAARLRSAGRPVVQVTVDDFHHPRAIRHRRGRASPAGFWLDSFDYPALRERVLVPLGPGGSRRYQPASHDLVTDERVAPPAVQAPPGAVVVLDGLFLHREALAACWDLSIFLRVPFAVSVARMAARDGTEPDPDHPGVARYVRGQQLYFAACAPEGKADVVVDNSDLALPVVIRSGSGR
jgi:uridine kinase